MASKWADKLYSKLVRCRTHSEAKALLDAAAEEVANIAADESRFWGAESKKEFAKRVLDKLGR